MTGNKNYLTSLQEQPGGQVSLGDKRKREIIGTGEAKITDSIRVKNVNLVKELGFNLLSVAQLCDQGNNKVTFTSKLCIVKNTKTKEIVLKGLRYNDVYIIDKEYNPVKEQCFASITDETELWHRRLGHANLHLINKLQRKELVRGLPRTRAEIDDICEACVKGKQTRTSFKSKQDITSTRPLELIHMDLCGPMRTKSNGGKRYMFVIVDDYSRFTWTLFLASKDEAFEEFESFIKNVERNLGLKLGTIRSDHGTEFENAQFLAYCKGNGVSHNFSAPRTPQQNGVVERKNRTLEDMSRTMLISSALPPSFWAEVINTAFYILNRVMLRPLTRLKSYALSKYLTS